LRLGLQSMRLVRAVDQTLEVDLRLVVNRELTVSPR
jgi:hypothetical protein